MGVKKRPTGTWCVSAFISSRSGFVCVLPIVLVFVCVGLREATAEGTVVMGLSSEVTTDEGVLYRVNFKYDFPDRPSIYIDGIGNLPSHGRLSFLSPGKTIQFFDRFGGQGLYTARVENPTVIMGDESVNIPRDSDFHEEYRQGHWAAEKPFAEAALSVLDHFFSGGYTASQRAGILQLVTVFAPLPPTTERIQVQVAVLVSSAANADPHNLDFTLRYCSREKRSHTEWRPIFSEGARTAVQGFVDKVFLALRGGVP